MVQTYHSMTPVLINDTNQTIQEFMDSFPVGIHFIQVGQTVSVEIGMPARGVYGIILFKNSTTYSVVLALPYDGTVEHVYKCSCTAGTWRPWVEI